MFPMPKERKAKIFKNGRSRAVRIPSDFDLPVDEVIIRQERDGLITIHPARPRRSPAELVEWLRESAPIGKELPQIEDLPLRPIDLDLPE